MQLLCFVDGIGLMLRNETAESIDSDFKTTKYTVHIIRYPDISPRAFLPGLFRGKELDWWNNIFQVEAGLLKQFFVN